MRRLVALVAVTAWSSVACLGSGGDSPRETTREARLSERLAYLGSIPEIVWHQVDNNDVYIGWHSKPDDFRLVNTTAALNGSAAIRFGVHVWSVNGGGPGWRPGDAGLLCTTTARGGKIEESDC